MSFEGIIIEYDVIWRYHNWVWCPLKVS